MFYKVLVKNHKFYKDLHSDKSQLNNQDVFSLGQTGCFSFFLYSFFILQKNIAK